MLGWLRQRIGGWLGPELSKGTDRETVVREEKARSGPAGIVLPWFLPWQDQDQTAGETSTMRRMYRLMLNDPHVKSAIFGKVFGLASQKLKFQPDGEGPLAKNVARFCDNNFNRRLKGKTRKLVEVTAVPMCLDGYCVAEKVFKPESKGEWNDKWILRDLKSKDAGPGNDLALLTDEFRNVTGLLGLRYNGGKVFSPAIFVIQAFMPLFESPTGMSDLRGCYASYWMLDTTKKLRMIGLDKRSVPILLGEYATQQQKPGLEAALQNARSSTWFSIPAGTKITALEIAGRSQDEYESAVRDFKHDIYIGLTFAILQGLEGNVTGARSIGEVHQDTAKLPQWYLSTLIQDILNEEEGGLVPDLVDMNFAGAGYPLGEFESIDLEELKAESDIDDALHNRGMDLSKKEQYERYGRKPPIILGNGTSDPQDMLKGAPPKPQTGTTPGGASPHIETVVKHAADEGAAASPFRFSESWAGYVSGSAADCSR